MDQTHLLARYDGRVPRYTSYPTAPHFSDAVGGDVYETWLRELPTGAPLSIYLHVPFCERLCLYCGCHTSVARHERPHRAYAAQLEREIAKLAACTGPREVAHVHWGGGTPTILPDDCLTGIMDLLRARFNLRADAEVAIEIDPTAFNAEKCKTLVKMGVNRASLGVQDFNANVQAAIGRVQSFEQTMQTAWLLRAAGIEAINLDLIYGLPAQTEDSVAITATQALALNAGRVAVFGYAHVPWMKRHQALIPESSLPDAFARFAQLKAIARVLEAQGGYVPVGLDHYAKPEDPMALAMRAHALRRGFQGYTTDQAPILLGLGASAVGSLPQGYVQNATSIPAYEASVQAGRFATARGVALMPDDRLRRRVIERIMCDLEVDVFEVALSLHMSPEPLVEAASGLGPFVEDGLVQWDGRRLCVTSQGRPFLRNVAALFDAYMTPQDSTPRYARAM